VTARAASIGPAVRRAREAQGISLRELADCSGIHYSTIHRYEHGKSIQLDSALAVADALWCGAMTKWEPPVGGTH
jgi:transcriptional regulator with XRE-family HTH domain